MAPKGLDFSFRPKTKGKKGGIADEVNVLIKSFHGKSPEALSRHKSRQQKAFTSLTQNKTPAQHSCLQVCTFLNAISDQTLLTDSISQIINR